MDSISKDQEQLLEKLQGMFCELDGFQSLIDDWRTDDAHRVDLSAERDCTKRGILSLIQKAVQESIL